MSGRQFGLVTERFAVEVGGGVAPREAHGQVEVGDEVLQDVMDAVGAAQRQAVDERPAHEAGVGAERQRLVDIRPAPDPGVEGDGRLVADRLDDSRQRLQGGDGAVDLAAAVGGDADAVGAVLDRQPGVLGVDRKSVV